MENLLAKNPAKAIEELLRKILSDLKTNSVNEVLT
jgi:hypothetical protein